MLERVKVWLRGDYNSIRYKYYHLPKEWLEYILLYKMCGKKWVDFYAVRLDRSAIISRNKPLHESYILDGQMHLDFLKSHGLKPSHKLFDYGCGVCRSGMFFAKYLEPGNYTGADISKERLEHGKTLMLEEGLESDEYELLHVTDCQLRELKGRKFDYVFANSVLTHMPEGDIRTMLAAMRSVLGNTGKFFFSYAQAEARKRRNIKDFWYRQDEMRALCEDAGYKFTILDDWPKQGDVMAQVSLKGNQR